MKESDKTVLCMIDLSANSIRVLQWAAEDAIDHQANLMVLYPYRLKTHRDGEQKSSVKKRLEQEALEQFEKFKSSLPILQKVNYTFSPEVGFETDRLDAHLTNSTIQLMVLGKEIVQNGNWQTEWTDFIGRTTVPVVLIP